MRRTVAGLALLVAIAGPALLLASTGASEAVARAAAPATAPAAVDPAAGGAAPLRGGRALVLHVPEAPRSLLEFAALSTVGALVWWQLSRQQAARSPGSKSDA